MEPNYRDEISELISASSAMNSADERKPYDGKFLTDEIQEVKEASMCVNTTMHEQLKKDIVYDKSFIEHCLIAITWLNRKVDGEVLWKTHPILAHSIEHIEAAILVNKRRKNG